MNILGTPHENFKTLEQRRADLTIKVFQRIQNDPTNPCNKFMSSYSHQHTNTINEYEIIYHMLYRIPENKELYNIASQSAPATKKSLIQF